MDIIFIINLFCSFFLCGLIWIIQLVHYPMFHKVSEKQFICTMQHHQKHISFIVVPVMIAELISSAALSYYADIYQSLHIAGLIVVISIWLITFFFQVPQHAYLMNGYNFKTVNRLISTNKTRTVLWTLKSILTVYILFLMLNG